MGFWGARLELEMSRLVDRSVTVALEQKQVAVVLLRTCEMGSARL